MYRYLTTKRWSLGLLGGGLRDRAASGSLKSPTDRQIDHRSPFILFFLFCVFVCTAAVISNIIYIIFLFKLCCFSWDFLVVCVHNTAVIYTYDLCIIIQQQQQYIYTVCIYMPVQRVNLKIENDTEQLLIELLRTAVISELSFIFIHIKQQHETGENICTVNQ